MKSFSQALLEDYLPQLDAVGRDYLRRVVAGSQRMGELIDDLVATGFQRPQAVKKANLEDVFLNLTGKEWRDE